VLADDSGLEVDIMHGAPGVWSARYAGVGATDADNRALLKRQMREAQERGAKAPFTGRFRCAMVLALDRRVRAAFDGRVEGHVLLQEEGEGGFGYDPLFVPEGHKHSFGVLSSEVKNSLSHRARALSQVVDWLRKSN